jgi:hypothetical protein
MVDLTRKEQAMLDGEQGPAVRQAMEIIVALATIYDADRLIPVEHVQVAGVSYKNLGDAGLAFLEKWAGAGARVRVPTTMNPAGMDMAQWETLGVPADFAAKQRRVVDAYQAMGIEPTLSCTPYLIGHRPRYGEHLAWSESSAVSYANSVLGARTNREGGPSALAAAITGRTPNSGYHLDAARQATTLVEVQAPLRDVVDFGALGYLVGKQVRQGVPYFWLATSFDWPLTAGGAGESRLKTLGAAMAASGAVALYHVEGVTPEAERQDMLSPRPERLVIDSLEEAYAALDQPLDALDLVTIGCPHASADEIGAIADLLAGQSLAIPLWVTTARGTREAAIRAGHVAAIEDAGGRVVADTCMVVAPVERLGVEAVATNSAKAAFYMPSHSGTSIRYGSLAKCLQAALTGRWPT